MSATMPGSDQPDENRGPHIIGTVIAVTTLALVTVCARIYVRIRMVHYFGISDWVIIGAMVLSLVGSGLVAGEVIYGAGRHAAYLDPARNKFGLELNFISQPVYLWAIPLVKLSVGLFLLRIAPERGYRRILQGTMIFLMAYTFMCFVTLLLQCHNISIVWDSHVKSTCWSRRTILGLSYANATVNILTDMFFALIPIPMLWNVQINLRTKASLICILGMGVFACIAAIIKSAYTSNYGKTGDFLWDSANLTIWVATETNTGIIAACLPCLKPLFKRMLGSSVGYSSSSINGGYRLRTYSVGLGPGSKFTRSKTITQIGSSRKPRTVNDHGHNRSQEIIVPHGGSNSHAITKTTVVVVDRSGEMDGPGRCTRSKMLDIDPERRVEDGL
ncbi:hypothetical protein BJ170DRAFT_735810 [Xylariales sp. AK1849]|nr:hypothetical protein BJ170DRAFT_735810 [Xylariales sp. AK1849]